MSSGGALPSEEHLRAAARQGVRDLVASRGPRLGGAVAAGALVTAAVCAPIVFPLLSGAAAATAVAGTVGLAGGLGTNLLSDVSLRVWDRLRSDGG